jgi:hypothetical protein
MYRYILFVLLFVLNACGNVPPDSYTAPRSPEVVARGAHLVKGLAACGFCHGVSSAPTSPLAGGRQVYDIYGAVESPNITPSKSGIGLFSDQQIEQSIRGIWKDAADKRSPTIHRGHEWLSSSDALAINAYLRSLTPINHVVKERRIGFASRNSTGLFSAAATVTGHVADTNPHDKIPYGKYLVNHVARCGSCHTTEASVFSSERYLAGGKIIRVNSQEFVAPPLLGTAQTMNTWSEPAIIEFFKAGKRADGTQVKSEACPVSFYRQASDEEVTAMMLYLRSLS